MKLMVLDGNSLVNRAFYGVGKNRLLTTRQGLHTNAIYGFVTMLQKLLDDEKPNAVCVTFDRREPTFRHKADAAYKATRKGMPDELAEQMLPLKHHQPPVRGGGLGLRHRHRRPGQPAADHRPHPRAPAARRTE